MSTLIDKVVQNGVVPVLEMPDSYVFNSQVYEKHSLKPIPFSFVMIDEIKSIFKRTVTDDTTFFHGRRTNNVEIDSQDFSITYVVGDSTSRVYKLKRQGGKIDVVATMNIDSRHTGEIVDQDGTHLYVFAHPQDTYTGGDGNQMNLRRPRMYKIDKETFTSVEVQMSGYRARVARVVTVDDEFIYIGLTRHWSGNTFDLIRYRKTTNSVTTLISSAVHVGSYALPSFTEDIGDRKEKLYLSVPSSNDGLVKMWEITIDKTDGSSSVEIKDCLHGHEAGTYEMMHTTGNERHIRENFIMYDNNEKYLVMILSYPLRSEPVRADTFFKVYKYNPADDNYVMIQHEPFTTTINGFLEMNDNKTLIIRNYHHIITYNWNTENERYEYILQNNVTNELIGSDEDENLWIQRIDGTVDIYSQRLPMQVVAKFENNSYTFEGTDISTYVEYFAKDFTGKNIEALVEMSLDGPCRFVENDRKVLVRSTSRHTNLITPVVVTGRGTLRVGIRILQG